MGSQLLVGGFMHKIGVLFGLVWSDSRRVLGREILCGFWGVDSMHVVSPSGRRFHWWLV